MKILYPEIYQFLTRIQEKKQLKIELRGHVHEHWTLFEDVCLQKLTKGNDSKLKTVDNGGENMMISMEMKY